MSEWVSGWVSVYIGKSPVGWLVSLVDHYIISHTHEMLYITTYLVTIYT